MNTIAIDCGSSFVKAALFDSEGKILKSISKKSPKVDLKENIFNTAHIETLTVMVKEIFSSLLADSDNEVNLCVSNEMHGFLLADEKGKPLTDYISWQHEFGGVKVSNVSAYDILSDVKYRQDIINSGMPLRNGLPNVNLLYLVHGGFLKNISYQIYFYTLGDYIIKILTDKEPICHLTNAAATGLLDLRLNRWNENILKDFFQDIKFPAIGNSTFEVSIQNKMVKVYPAIGDQQAALYGAGLSDETELSFNIGTGGQVSKILSKIKFSADYQVRPFFNGKYIKTIPHLPSGRALNVYIRFFEDVLKQFDITVTEEEIWQKILDAQSKIDKSDLICDLSFFENAASQNVTGSITNIGEYSLNVGNLTKSVINQMADNFFKAALKIESDKNSVKKILFSGGVAKRIKPIRDRILLNYDCNNYEVAESDTLYGLFKYVNSE